MMDTIPFYVTAAGNRSDDLEGEICPLKLYEAPYEASVSIDGFCYHLIFGRHRYGWFLCVPDWNIGVEMSHPGDLFWNRESLIRSGINETTAICLAQALRILGKHI